MGAATSSGTARRGRGGKDLPPAPRRATQPCDTYSSDPGLRPRGRAGAIRVVVIYCGGRRRPTAQPPTPPPPHPIPHTGAQITLGLSPHWARASWTQPQSTMGLAPGSGGPSRPPASRTPLLLSVSFHSTRSAPSHLGRHGEPHPCPHPAWQCWDPHGRRADQSPGNEPPPADSRLSRVRRRVHVLSLGGGGHGLGCADPGSHPGCFRWQAQRPQRHRAQGHQGCPKPHSWPSPPEPAAALEEAPRGSL